MNAIFKRAGIIDPHPPRHHDIKPAAVSVGNFIQHLESSNSGAVTGTCRNDVTEYQFTLLVSIKMLLRDIDLDFFCLAGRPARV